MVTTSFGEAKPARRISVTNDPGSTPRRGQEVADLQVGIGRQQELPRRVIEGRDLRQVQQSARRRHVHGLDFEAGGGGQKIAGLSQIVSVAGEEEKSFTTFQAGLTQQPM